METENLHIITAAVAPIVMVSAAGLLFLGLQTKNLHLADRIRQLTAEYRTLRADPAQKGRLEQLRAQLPIFARRVRLSHRALEFLYASILCFVMSSLLLASMAWIGGAAMTAVVALLFFVGVCLILISLLLEFVEMSAGLATIGSEIEQTMRDRTDV